MKCTDHCKPPLLRMSLNNEAASPSFSRHSLILLVVASGDAHPIVVFCHNVRCASFWRVPKRLPEPLRETVQCLSMGSSAGRCLQLWRPVHHDRCDVLLPISKSDGACLPCSFQGASNVLTTFLGFHVRVLTGIEPPGDMFEKRVWAYPHLISKCLPCCETLDLCKEPSPARRKGRRMCALISSLMFRILDAQRAKHVLWRSTRKETSSRKQGFLLL